MNMLRFFKLKELNGELDDCTQKELFLIYTLAHSKVEFSFETPPYGLEKTTYYIDFIDNWDEIILSSTRTKMFGHIHRDVLCGYDNKFYKDMYNKVYHDEFEYWSAYNDTIIYWDVVKTLTSLDKKFKISKNIFKANGLGS